MPCTRTLGDAGLMSRVLLTLWWSDRIGGGMGSGLIIGIWTGTWILTGISIRFRIWTRIGIALFIRMPFGIWARLRTTILDYDRY